MESSQSRSRTSPEQFAALIEFMERHGDIARPQQGAQGRIKADRLWQELEQLLNSFGGGVTRPIEKWKKIWADWKTKTKKKASLINRESRATGGGPSGRQTLSALEQRVLGVMGMSAVAGLPGIEERGFDSTGPSSERLPHDNTLNIETNAQASVTEFVIELVPSPSLTTGALEDSSSRSVIRGPQSPREVLCNPTPVAPPAAGRAAPPAAGRAEPPSPVASVSSPRRRRLFRAHRRMTPFEEATAKFVDVEQRRLQLEETRERNFHEREMLKIQLESRRIEMEENRNTIYRSIADNIHNLPNVISRLIRSPSLASTDILSSDP